MDERRAPLPARMLNEWVYCPRLFHLMHVQRLFADSADTVEGRGQHERSRGDAKGTGLTGETPWGTTAIREVSFVSADGLLTGRFDVVARAADGSLVPVEAKHGAAPRDKAGFDVCGVTLPGDAWPTDRIQVGAQVRLLRDAGEACHEARIYYRKDRQTVIVTADETLDTAVRRAVEDARACAEGPMPPPLLDSPKCIGCSLSTICLPEETNFLLARQRETPRRVIPGRADGGGLYVLSQGARVGKTSDAIVITPRDGDATDVPSKDIEHLAVFGQVQVTTQALTLLAEQGKPVFFHGSSGRLATVALPPGRPNLDLRRRQFRAADDAPLALRIAKSLLTAKLRNQRTLIRRNAEPGTATAETLAIIDRAMTMLGHADTLEALMGHEGLAARAYFDALALLFGSDDTGPVMSGRSRRPPADPVNAALSFGYALLTNDCIAALWRVGLDPDLGFLHQPVPGRPALALDLMEPFRPLVVDSLVLRMFSTRQLQRHDFAQVGPAWRLHDRPRRELVAAYERRVDELITHPVFDYRISYRRVLELEARLLGRVLTGELDEWTPLVTR